MKHPKGYPGDINTPLGKLHPRRTDLPVTKAERWNIPARGISAYYVNP